MKAMVLAAGVGSRLEPLTTKIPKPMVPVANRPVMEHILRLLKQYGINDVVSNLYHLSKSLTDYFADGSSLGTRLTFHVEENLTGDAGGVRACRSFLAEDTFVVLMGDLLTDANLAQMIASHKQKKALATIGLKRVEDVSHFGVALVDKEGFITGFQEKPSPAEALSNLASTGIYIFEPEIFAHIPPSGSYGFGRQLFPQLVQQGLPVLGAEITSYWSDVGTIKQYRLSNFDALTGKLHLELPGTKTEFGWIGKQATVSDTACISGLLMLGDKSSLGKNVQIKGQVVIGANCRVADYAVIENSVIWDNTSISTGAQIQDSIIGNGCVVTEHAKMQEATMVVS